MSDLDVLAYYVFDKMYKKVSAFGKSTMMLSIDYSQHINTIKTEVIEKFYCNETILGILEALKIIYINESIDPFYLRTEAKSYSHLFTYIIKFIDEKIKEQENIIEKVKPKKISKTNRIKSKTLKEIWLTEDDGGDYDTCIDELKKVNLCLGFAFVTENNNKLQWVKSPTKGWQQYMAGFVYTLMKHKWIKEDYSAPELVEILYNTFNVKTDVNPFKEIIAAPPKEKYLNPFTQLPTKI